MNTSDCLERFRVEIYDLLFDSRITISKNIDLF